MAMRHGQQPEFLLNNGKVEAVCLGADFTAEHEWGIKGLTYNFGLSEDLHCIGIERRRITELPEPERLFFLDDGKAAMLWYGSYIHSHVQLPAGETPTVEKLLAQGGILQRECSIYRWKGHKDDPNWKPIAAAWSAEDFCIVVEGTEYRQYLTEIYIALKKKELAIWTGGGHVFKRAGLVLGIIPNCTAENLKVMEEADKVALFLHLENEKVEKELKLTERFKEKFKGTFLCYIQLFPKLASEHKTVETKYPIIYWFNSHMKEIEYGYMSVERLVAYLEGNEEILKKDK
jgi:hypothetical protein